MIVTTRHTRLPTSTFPERNPARIREVTGGPTVELSFLWPFVDTSAKAFGLSRRAFLEHTALKKFVRYRAAAMWVAYHGSMRSQADIGRAFDREHTTVVYNIRQADRRINRGDRDMIECVKAIVAAAQQEMAA
jgi:hypothetical protein